MSFTTLTNNQLELARNWGSVGAFPMSIPVAKKTWTKGGGDFTSSTRTLGFIAQHASSLTCDVKIKYKVDDDYDIITVNVNQEYSGEIVAIKDDSGTTAQKVIILV